MHWLGRSKLKVLCVVAGLVAMVAAALWWSGAQEPSYQGKPLSFWLGTLSGTDKEGALEAIDRIGPKAIPTLLRRLQTTDSKVKLEVLRVGRSIGLLDHSRATRNLAFDRRREAVQAFIRLGERAKPAVPELRKLTEHADVGIRAMAWEVLAAVAGEEFNDYLRAKPIDAQAVEAKTEDLPDKE